MPWPRWKVGDRLGSRQLSLLRPETELHGSLALVSWMPPYGVGPRGAQLSHQRSPSDFADSDGYESRRFVPSPCRNQVQTVWVPLN